MEFKSFEVGLYHCFVSNHSCQKSVCIDSLGCIFCDLSVGFDVLSNSRRRVKDLVNIYFAIL